MQYIIQTTKSQQFINITNKVAEEVAKSNIRNGIAVIFVPHTTAGVTINENADPDVVSDMISTLEKRIPYMGLSPL